MQALDHDVKHAARVNGLIDAVVEGEREDLLVALFDAPPLATEGWIVGEGLQLAQSIEVGDPLVADPGVDQVGEARVGETKKAARRDTVGLVLELLWTEV